MRRHASLLLVGALALPLGLASCGGPDRTTVEAADTETTALRTLPPTDTGSTEPEEAAAAAPASPPATPAPSTTRPPSTTARPSTTVGLTTVVTLADTTLPEPAPPPPPRAQEPYIEWGTIEIPKLGVTKPLLEGITLNTLDRGPGHWPGTAMPGQVGNAVIAGHRTSHDKPFRDIDQLAIGDEVIFTTPDGRFVYEVTGTTIVQPDAMYIIDQTPASTATLFACHPPGSTRQRIVVSLALVQ